MGKLEKFSEVSEELTAYNGKMTKKYGTVH
jgi:hypothetical protein